MTYRRRRSPRSRSRSWRTWSSAGCSYREWSAARGANQGGAVRAVVQTVSKASVTVDGEVVGAITDGLLVLVGVTHSDGPQQADTLARKVAELRILDEERSALDV